MYGNIWLDYININIITLANCSYIYLLDTYWSNNTRFYTTNNILCGGRMIGTFEEFIEYHEQDQYQRKHVPYYNIPYIEQENPLMNFDNGLVLQGSYKGKCLQFITLEVDRKYFHRILELRVFEGNTSDKEIDKMLQDYEKLNQKEKFVTDLCNIFIVGTSILILCMWFMLVRCFLPSIMAIFVSLFGTFCCAGYLVNWHGFSRSQNVH